MHGDSSISVLRHEGFEIIGSFHHRLQLTVWWNPAPDKLVDIIVLRVGERSLIKGSKSYYLRSVTTDGETWVRDLGALHDYLESHFPEVRIGFSHFRDLPPDLAEAEVRRRLAIDAPSQQIPTVEQVAELQQQLRSQQQELQSNREALRFLSPERDLLTGYLNLQSRTQTAQADLLKNRVEHERQRLERFQHLQREYRRKGSAAVYSFSISSNLQLVEDGSQFRDAVRAVVKELADMARYQVSQKLTGGRLNIQIAEASEPIMTWIEQWLGGALSPTQMRRLQPPPDSLLRVANERIVVTPDEPIVVDDRVRHAEKHLAARFLSTVVQRLDKTEGIADRAALSPDVVPVESMPLSLGRRVEDAGGVIEPLVFPLSQMVHVYISGTTGSGKSFLARVMLEEAAQYQHLNILVLDPRNQSVGLLVPEDRTKILQQYDGLGMKPEQARGFKFDYFAPGLPYAPELPGDVSQVAKGRVIVSLKGLDDARRCDLAAQILDAAFTACSVEESERPRLLILVDEAQLFTRKRVDDSARQAAAHTERALDRIAREGRKYGIVLTLVSQMMKDFGYDLASIRQMTTTKIFLRNSDREIEYASDIIGDGRQLAQLPTGTALVHNANWGVVKIKVRPPYSKVFELRETEIRQLSDKHTLRGLTSEAQRVLTVIKDASTEPAKPLNMSRLAILTGISSKRRLIELVDQLTDAHVIQTRTMPERGRPRIIELVP